MKNNTGYKKKKKNLKIAKLEEFIRMNYYKLMFFFFLDRTIKIKT